MLLSQKQVSTPNSCLSKVPCHCHRKTFQKLTVVTLVLMTRVLMARVLMARVLMKVLLVQSNALRSLHSTPKRICCAMHAQHAKHEQRT